MMRSVREIEVYQNIPVLVRSALNVPVENGQVANDYRLRRALPTIKYLRERGARVILISHLGEKGTETLKSVAEALGRLIPGVKFFGETVGARARDAVRDLSPGNILVMENLRRNRGERLNDAPFSKELASLADIFVQDSFDTCHRPHASIIGVPKHIPAYAGLLFVEEYENLSAALKPTSPSVVIVGGAKFETKEPLIRKLLELQELV